MNIKGIIFLIFIGFLTGCGIYNFSGSSISPDIKTITITNIINETGQGPPRLAQNFTEKLKDYYQSNTSLRVVQNNADLNLEGVIVGYTLTPLAPSGNEVGSRNRLTMTVKIKFENTRDSSQNVNQSFSQYGNDFDQNKPFSSVENDEIEVIFDKLLLDIFAKTTGNW